MTMAGRSRDPLRTLAELERQLEALERGGVRWLNVAPDPQAAPAGSATAGVTVPAAAPAPDARAAPPAPAAAGAAAATGAAAAGGADDERPHPSALATLDALRGAFAECRACKLCEGRRQVVFGVGHPRPRLLFVGEGPGADEDAQGEPFVGRAGALLTGLIRALGLVRDDVYITNVVKCRPPGNRTPEPDEVASCRPILQRQIELLDPRLIVCLGNVPLKVLKPEAAGITRERGVLFTYQRWSVLPTFHPSYLLRNPAAIEACWKDFRTALQLGYLRT